MATIKFTARKFSNATGKVVAWASGIDKAIEAGNATLGTWAQLAISGIEGGAITIDDVAREIIAGCGLKPDESKIGDCGSTIKGRFYALKRIVADTPSAERIMNGEAFTKVAADAPAIQKQKTGKRSNGGGGKAGPVTKVESINLGDTLKSLHLWLDTAAGNAELAERMAAMPEVTGILAKLAKVEATAKAAVASREKVKATRKAVAKRKATGKANTRRAKAAVAKGKPATRRAKAA